MDNITKQPSRRGLCASIACAILVALCCFTPLLVIILGIVGFSVFTPYVDYFLYPALALLIIITWVSYRRYKTECKACGINPKII